MNATTKGAITLVLRWVGGRIKGGAIMKALQGRKTYILGVLTILGGLYTWFLGGDMKTGIEAIIAGFAMMTLRSGITSAAATGMNRK